MVAYVDTKTVEAVVIAVETIVVGCVDIKVVRSVVVMSLVYVIFMVEAG